ncbi:hypothetical protein AB0A73_09355 [Glycomyces sp. NPDC047369]
MNDLIVNDTADAPPMGELDGARALASAQDLMNSDSGLEYALNGTVAALDLLAFVANPFKEFLMAGVGFLIEHVDFLREPLEWVAGDPGAINATKDTWNNIAAALDQAGADLQAEVGSLSEWQGDAAEAYRTLTADFGSAIQGAGTASSVMGGYMMVMGIWTAVTRGLILELICDFVSRAIMYALAALASSWITLGGSFAAMIGGIVVDAMGVGAKIMKHLTKLGDAMQMLNTRFTKLNEIVGDLGRVLSKFAAHKQIDLGFDALKQGTNLKFDQLSSAIKNDIPLPGNGYRSGYQSDIAKDAYDVMGNLWSSGKLNVPGMTGAYNLDVLGNPLGDILTGYPMTGLKSLLGGTPGAVQDGG